MTPPPSAPPHWHALDPADVCGRLDTRLEGLDDAEAARRLRRFGPNILRATPPTPAWRILLAQFNSVIVLLLAAAAGIAFVSGDTIDALAITFVLLLNAGLGFATELPARRTLEALTALETPSATAIRAGSPREIPARDLVPGDVIALEAGQALPADARLLRSVELRTNEAALTGESEPQDKDARAVLAADTPLPDRRTMVYQGTTVVAGTARAAIVATGMATELGRIGTLAGALPERRTPLERRLDALGRRLAIAALAVAAIVALLGFLQGVPLATVLAVGIALAVAAVPEALPAVVTVAMAVGVRRMARRRALVRRLPVVETLGSATVICTDKTGTLTTGEMTATDLWLGGRDLEITGVGYAMAGGFLEQGRPVDPAADPQLTLALRIAALANRAGLSEQEGVLVPRGDPTEVALLVAARKAGVDPAELSSGWPEVGELPFSSERMYMATFHRAGRDGITAYAKGAPRRVLERCDRMLAITGERALDPVGRANVLRRAEALAGRGLRVLALAAGPVTSASEDAMGGLALVGLIGLADPPAPHVLETIRALQAAGIRTVMLTGDHRATAEAVAVRLELLDPGGDVLDGRDLATLGDTALAERLDRAVAFSRVSPEDKLRIVAGFQARGDIVAMLGDGVNDAAALKRAEIGVAMGRRGSDVAREAASLVLQDDRFPTVAAAVEEGRVIFDNVRKFVFYLFSCNLAEVLVFLGAGLAGWPMPLRPLQILWLNLVTDTFPALALALEPAEPDIMRRPPRHPRTAILSGRMLTTTVLYGLLICLCSLAAMAWGLVRWPDDPARVMTLTFATLGLAQIFHLGNARSTSAVVTAQRALSNRHALAAVVLALLLQALALEWRPLTRILDVSPMPLAEWGLVLALGLAPGVLGQASKVVRERWRAARSTGVA